MKNVENRPRTDHDSGHSTERDTIARLLRFAGPRPSVPRAAEERVREGTRGAWRAAVRARQRRRFLWLGTGLAAAAGLAFAMVSIPRSVERPTPLPSARVATLSTTTGDVVRLVSGRAPEAIRNGEELFSGDVLETVEGSRAALTLAGGATLRLDRDSRIRLLGERAVALEAGALYFDSANDPIESGALDVHTRFGVVRDIGTQFEVRQDGELRVRVREGRIHLDQEGSSWQADAGTELRLTALGRLSRHPTPTFGPSWDWILDVSPGFTLEGHTLEAFLAWVSRETGLEVEFVDEATARAAADVVLHGSIAGLRPDRALEAVLPTCGLERRVRGGILLIEAETR